MRALVSLWIICGSAIANASEMQDWFAYLNKLGFWERLAEIRAVSDLPKSDQRDRVPVLIRLLDDKDQSVRLTAAQEIAEIHDVSEQAIPSLINNFKYENGEEGMGYVKAVAAFGNQVLPSLRNALESENWLVRVRACDAIRLVNSKLYLDGECKQEAR